MITIALAAAMASAVQLSDGAADFASMVGYLEELGKNNADYIHHADPAEDFKDPANIAKAWADLATIKNGQAHDIVL